MARTTAKRWTSEELLLACGLYYTIPFAQMHHRNPRIIRIAEKLDRTPSSVSMLLCNLASLDPELQKRGIKGLAHPSNAARAMWEEYHQNREQLTVESEMILRTIEGPVAELEPEFAELSATTESEAMVSVRRMQSYFRRMILGAYESRCCMTGLPVAELLVASHVLPWAKFPQYRLDRGNGLCLASHFDRAFDRGLIAFDESYRMVVGHRLRAHADNAVVASEFLAREGQPLLINEDVRPNPAFIAQHRIEFFDR
jgi:hypothetical protein